MRTWHALGSLAGGILHGVRLSRREQEALQHLFQGMSYASIARRLTKVNGEPVSAATVKDYVGRARAKFAAVRVPCKSNYALLARCIELGLIRPGGGPGLSAGTAVPPCPPHRGHAVTPVARHAGAETAG